MSNDPREVNTEIDSLLKRIDEGSERLERKRCEVFGYISEANARLVKETSDLAIQTRRFILEAKSCIVNS